MIQDVYSEACKRVLALIGQHDHVTQPDLARQARVTRAAINNHVLKLMADRLIIEDGWERGSDGRPAMRLTINRTANVTLGISLGDDLFQVTLVDFAGQVVWRDDQELSPQSDQATILRYLGSAMATAKKQVRQQSLFLRGGICAVAAKLDVETGRVERSDHFPALAGLNLEEYFQKSHDIRVPTVWRSRALLSNYISAFDRSSPDASELSAVHPEPSRVALFEWGDKIGWSQVDTRSLQFDTSHSDRNIRHVRVKVKGGRPCSCGQRGCLQAEVGGPAVLDELRQVNARLRKRFARANFSEVAKLAQRGDPEVSKVMENLARCLGRYLAWPIQFTDPQLLVIDSYLGLGPQRLLSAFRKGLAEVAHPECLEQLNIQVITARNEIVHGAAKLARMCFFYPHLNPRIARVAPR